MSYFDPEVYNYEGLIEDDKKHIDGFDAAIEEISSAPAAIAAYSAADACGRLQSSARKAARPP